jgi:hypothetical protein
VPYPGADLHHFTSNPLGKFIVCAKAFDLVLLEETLSQFSAGGICFTRPFLGFSLSYGPRMLRIVSIYDFACDKKFPQAAQPEIPELHFGPPPSDVEPSFPPDVPIDADHPFTWNRLAQLFPPDAARGEWIEQRIFIPVVTMICLLHRCGLCHTRVDRRSLRILGTDSDVHFVLADLHLWTQRSAAAETAELEQFRVLVYDLYDTHKLTPVSFPHCAILEPFLSREKHPSLPCFEKLLEGFEIVVSHPPELQLPPPWLPLPAAIPEQIANAHHFKDAVANVVGAQPPDPALLIGHFLGRDPTKVWKMEEFWTDSYGPRTAFVQKGDSKL